MQAAFYLCAIVIVLGALGAMFLRNLVHCALSLALTFSGLAVLYLLLDAHFLAFVQILVYVGAVSILIVFAVLLTRGSETPAESRFSGSWLAGVGIALVLFCVLASSIRQGQTLKLNRSVITRHVGEGPNSTVIVMNRPRAHATVREIGAQLLTTYLLPLETMAVLLTVGLIGAVLVAMPDRKKDQLEVEPPAA